MKIVCAGRDSETLFYNFGAHKQAELGKKDRYFYCFKNDFRLGKNLGSS